MANYIKWLRLFKSIIKLLLADKILVKYDEVCNKLYYKGQISRGSDNNAPNFLNMIKMVTG